MLTLTLIVLVLVVLWMLWGPIPSPARIFVTVVLSLVLVVFLLTTFGGLSKALPT